MGINREVCSGGVPIDFNAEFHRVTTAVQPGIATIAQAWPADRVAELRGVGTGMMDGPLTEAMMLVTPCDPAKPQVGLAINYIEGSSCHTHTRDGIGARANYYLTQLGLSPNTFIPVVSMTG